MSKETIKYADFYKKIGRNIAKFRVEQGYTQEEFANKIGISYSYYTQIEAPNVVTKMSLEALLDIAVALKKDIKDLLP
jgi:transcriptional regulator with XRE-family HTH domain